MADRVYWIEANGTTCGIDLDHVAEFIIAEIGGQPTVKLSFAGREDAFIVNDPTGFNVLLERLQVIMGNPDIKKFYKGHVPKPV